MRDGKGDEARAVLSIGLVCILALFFFFPLPSRAAPEGATMSEQEQALELHLVKGTVEFGRENYEGALREFLAAREAVPEDFSANLLLGMTYLKLKRYGEAVEALKKAHELRPDASEAYLPLGQAYYLAEDYQAALPFLERALEADPDNALAHYLLGATLFRLERYEEARGPLRRAGELDPTLKQSVDFMRGAAAFRLGLVEEAKELFREAQRIDPKTDLAGFSERFARGIELQERARRRFAFLIRSSFGYDTNVRQIFSEFITNRGSLVTTYEAGAQFRPFLEPGLTSAVGYSFLGQVPHEFEELDIQGHVGYLFLNKRIGPFWLTPQYAYNFYSLDDDSFLQVNSLKVALNLPWRQTLSQVFYEFQDREFFTIRLRKGSVHAVGVKELVAFLDGRVRLEVGYRTEEEATTGDDFDRILHTLTGELTLPLPLEAWLEIRSQYQFKDYLHVHSLFDVERDEEEQVYGGYISRRFGKHLTLTAGWQYINVNSNVEVFDMNKNYYTAEVTIDF
jgi:tetratricopeptide (TPR) repeat protein